MDRTRGPDGAARVSFYRLARVWFSGEYFFTHQARPTLTKSHWRAARESESMTSLIRELNSAAWAEAARRIRIKSAGRNRLIALLGLVQLLVLLNQGSVLRSEHTSRQVNLRGKLFLPYLIGLSLD